MASAQARTVIFILSYCHDHIDLNIKSIGIFFIKYGKYREFAIYMMIDLTIEIVKVLNGSAKQRCRFKNCSISDFVQACFQEITRHI